MMSDPRSTWLQRPLDATRADDQRFAEELAACRVRLFRVALLLLGSREEAEDVTQGALLKALEGRERFRGASEVYTWLYRILLNQAKDLWKRRGRAARCFAEAAPEQVEGVADGRPGAEALLERGEEEMAVRRVLARLDPLAREVLVLRHYEEMSYEQMAEALGVPKGTVRSRLSAARERFRRLLAGEEGR